MSQPQKNINEFDLYNKLLNDSLNLLNDDKIDECKILLKKLKIFFEFQSKTKDLEDSIFIDDED